MEIKTKTKYGLKDQMKAKIAQAYIGYGIKGSSTELYKMSAIEQNIPINEKIEPGAGLIIFASINGGQTKKEQQEKTLEQIIRCNESGAKIVMDNDYHANRSYNQNGEAFIQRILKQKYRVEYHKHYNLFYK